jgi:flagellar FliJ protein
MVKRSKRLKPVVKLAASKERDAAVLLAECQRRRNEQLQRLDDLITYRQEYLQRLQTAGSEGMEASQFQDYRLFLERLDTAVRQQRELVAEMEADFEKKKGDWFHKRGKTKVLESVVSRYRQEETRQQARREQDEADDRAQHRPGAGRGSS